MKSVFVLGAILFKKLLIKYYSLKSKNSKPTIIALGDSWINFSLYYLFCDKLRRYLKVRKSNFDTSDWLRTYREYNLIDGGFPGYQLVDEMKNKFFKTALSNQNDQSKFAILLSFGGNDLTVEFDRFIKGAGAAARLNKKLLKKVLTIIYFDYLKLYINEINVEMQKRRINHNRIQYFIHGYDYFRPDIKIETGAKHERFKRLYDDFRIPRDVIKRITHEFVDITNTELERFTRKIGNLNFIDLRGTVKTGEWFEPIHPTPEGYRKIAKKIVEAMRVSLT